MKPLSIVLLILDSVRYDRLSFNGYQRNTMPGLEDIAERARRFTSAFAAAPWTLPSHASIFTGKYPTEHGATHKTLQIGGKAILAAEALREAGCRTGLFTANGWLTQETGLARGFEYIFGDPHRQKAQPMRLDARFLRKVASSLGVRSFEFGSARLVAELVRVLKDSLTKGEPCFLAANLLDAHLPLRPSARAASKFLSGPLKAPKDLAVPSVEHEVAAGLRSLQPLEISQLSDLYDASLFDLDRSLNRLFSLLSDPRWEGQALLIVTADHGENLGDHGLMGHQFCLYDTLIHVPLIVYRPGVVQPETRCELVQLTDLYHTILTQAGIDDSRFEVRPELDLAGDGPGYSERQAVFAEYCHPAQSLDVVQRRAGTTQTPDRLKQDVAAIRTRQYKYIYTGEHGSPGELYDVLQDTGERRNLVSGLPEIAAQLKGRLLRWREGLEAKKASPRSGAREVLAQMDDAVLKRLKDLGYL